MTIQKTLFFHDLSIEEAEELIKNGADVNIKNSYGDTPLYLKKSFKFVKLLIENGADVNARNIDDMTPLFFTMHPDIAQLLITHGADINAKDSAGLTRLHDDFNEEIIKNKSSLYDMHSTRASDMMIFLIENGAEINVRTIYGDTPLDFQLSSLNARELIKHGAIAGKSHTYKIPQFIYACTTRSV
jgi:ankyrin repeat protein